MIRPLQLVLEVFDLLESSSETLEGGSHAPRFGTLILSEFLCLLLLQLLFNLFDISFQNLIFPQFFFYFTNIGFFNGGYNQFSNNLETHCVRLALLTDQAVQVLTKLLLLVIIKNVFRVGEYFLTSLSIQDFESTFQVFEENLFDFLFD